jgi:hypothetical protein
MQVQLGGASDWEAAWAPYDEDTYRAALDLLWPTDVALDIGAGDLRFARRAAARTRAVVAIEQRAELLTGDHPPNLNIICGDARVLLFPRGVTVGVLLMRHCQHSAEYVAKLRAVGCTRLITNARWRMGVEEIYLAARRVPFESARDGWYACICGATGFIASSAEAINAVVLDRVTEVEKCPECNKDK